MRHFKRLKKLGLKKSHRDSLVKNLVSSLVLSGRLRTTESRAKVLASRMGRIMSLVKRKEKREAIRLLPKYCWGLAASKKIVDELKPKYENRSSGFTRITRVGVRKGDNASYVQIELL